MWGGAVGVWGASPIPTGGSPDEGDEGLEEGQ